MIPITLCPHSRDASYARRGCDLFYDFYDAYAHRGHRARDAFYDAS